MHVLMTIKAGNSHIRFGLMDGDQLIGKFRLSTKPCRTSDEYMMCMDYFLHSVNLKREDICDVIIASVVPENMHAICASIRKLFHREPMIVGPGTKTGIQLRFENAKEIGSDRIVYAAAAHYLYQKDCIVTAFGTATTFDYVSKEGIFGYTIIEPGIRICASALKNAAAKLPAIEIEKPKKILARNTVQGMQAGLVYGYIGSVEGILKEMKKELHKPDCMVIATGGLGRIICENCKAIDRYDPDFAFQGLRILYQLNHQ